MKPALKRPKRKCPLCSKYVSKVNISRHIKSAHLYNPNAEDMVPWLPIILTQMLKGLLNSGKPDLKDAETQTDPKTDQTTQTDGTLDLYFPPPEPMVFEDETVFTLFEIPEGTSPGSDVVGIYECPACNDPELMFDFYSHTCSMGLY